ncbi:hypothetical protein [Caballeronia cordobensis]|uniref:hypothetical protein n=1 Tax=Caballeronia cordobensis TaxID=1353886 RepID=UPI00045F0055|nr:hypothetical protein BRPE67_ACDS09540 [Burkholderia sp. RPE67]
MTKSVTELQAELEQVRELFLAAVATRADGSTYARRYEEIQRELTARGHSPN